MTDEIEEEVTLLSEDSSCHSWVNKGWEGRRPVSGEMIVTYEKYTAYTKEASK